MISKFAKKVLVHMSENRFAVSRYYMRTQEYEFNKNDPSTLLGSGSFGDVYKGTRKTKGKKIDVAIKILKNSLKTSSEQVTFMREIEVLARLHHPTLLELLGFTVPMGDMPSVQISTPLMPNGSLRQVLASEYKGLAPNDWNDTKKACVAFGIAVGMAYVHKNKVIHRDLKTDNILLDEDFYPHIADFGLSKVLSQCGNQPMQMTMNRGTPLYMAPELFEGDPNYTIKVDVYAYGMLLYELCTCQLPFSDKKDLCKYTIGNYIVNNIRPTIPEDTPNSYKNLMMMCWNRNPNERPDFINIVEEASNNEKLCFPDTDLDEYYQYQELVLQDL